MNSTVIDALNSVLKSFDYYGDKLKQLTRDLYNGKIEQEDFENKMGDLIEKQLRRAWNDGMRENGLDPKENMTDALESKLQDAIVKEYDYLRGFAEDIEKAAENKTGFEGLYNRAEMWQNRYIDITNRATMATADPDSLFRWDYGQTEKHCATCASVVGQIHTRAEWDDIGIEPQSRDLDCGGWQCDCRFVLVEPPKKKKETENAKI
jgi:hypothetical protein